MFDSLLGMILDNIGKEIIDEFNKLLKTLYYLGVCEFFYINKTKIEAKLFGLLNVKNICIKAITYLVFGPIQEQSICNVKLMYEKLGIKLEVHDKAKRSIVTTFGILTLDRKYLRPKCEEDKVKLYTMYGKKIIYPLDLMLKIDKKSIKTSCNLECIIAFLNTICTSHEKGVFFLRHFFKINISEETSRKITNKVGELIFKHDTKEANEIIKNKDIILKVDPTKEGYAIIEMDGSFLWINGENNQYFWLEVKIGLVSSSDNLQKYKDKDGNTKYRMKQKKYVAYLGNYENFKKYLLSIFIKNKYYLYKNLIILGDGAVWIGSFKKEFFPNSVQILDYYHLSERVWEYVKFIIKDPKEIKECAQKWCKMLKESKWEEVLKLLEPYKDIKLSKDVVNLYNYILNNSNNIDYKSYISKGYFIGSGAIESANKFVSQTRLKQPGMRWKKTRFFVPCRG